MPKHDATRALKLDATGISPLYDVKITDPFGPDLLFPQSWTTDTHAPAHCALTENGGARRDRTDDLMLAKHALSQLSYGPNPVLPEYPVLSIDSVLEIGSA